MNYLLVGFTLLVLATTMVALAVLGSDRVFPARRSLQVLAEDGTDVPASGEMPLILSSEPSALEFENLKFSQSFMGYNRDEVDAVIQQLSAENRRLAAARLHGADPHVD
ncbi:MAG: DivIVA domain-containing protein [Rothia sp. (in: high G+C Gram-positive bacteria)]|nr:DivIVA domain-containing protein [Rothia sp. (in: high G+C Gram-positive bacteria)]